MTDLDARYGRAPRSRRGLPAWIAAGVVVVLAAVWFLWANPLGLGTQLDFAATKFTAVDDRSVQLDFEVTVQPGRTAQCVVEAQSTNEEIVGWAVVAVPATGSYSRTLRTTQPAVAGLVDKCWLS